MRCGAPKHLLSCNLKSAVGVKRATQSEAALHIPLHKASGVLPSPLVLSPLAGYKGQRIKRRLNGDEQTNCS